MSDTLNSPYRPTSQDTPTRDRDQAANLVRHYRIGQELLRRHQRRERGLMARAAAEHGMSKAYTRLAMDFAAAYDERQLGDLLAGRGPDGRPLSLAHVRVLVGVRPPGLRRTFQDRALAEGWSTRELAARVMAHLGNRRPEAGRKPDQGDDLATTLVRIEAESRRWLNRCRAGWQQAFNQMDLQSPCRIPRTRLRTIGNLLGELIEEAGRLRGSIERPAS